MDTDSDVSIYLNPRKSSEFPWIYFFSPSSPALGFYDIRQRHWAVLGLLAVCLVSSLLLVRGLYRSFMERAASQRLAQQVQTVQTEIPHSSLAPAEEPAEKAADLSSGTSTHWQPTW